MRLTPRLATVAEMIPEGEAVADIGTDIFLPLFLAREGHCRKVLRITDTPAKLLRARRLINLFNLDLKIQLRLGSGLGALRPEDGIGVVVAAGVIGRKICRILTAGRSQWPLFKTFLLQPLQGATLLRRWLLSHDFSIVRERLVKEGERYYQTLAIQRGRQQGEADPFLYELGPCLIREGDPLLAEFIDYKLRCCRSMLESPALFSNGPAISPQRRYLQQRETRLVEVLARVGDR